MTQRVLNIAQILWPAFLIAGVLEMVVFAWVDPSQLRWGEWQPDTQTTYSLAFLVFWALVTVSAMVSLWMMRASSESPARLRRARRLARRQQLSQQQHGQV